MADKLTFRPPPEPAHVSLVRQFEDLVAILKYFRDKGQEVIDRGFDRVSSQIGFVVATTLPVTVELNERGKIVHLGVRGEHLEGTLFDTELLPALKKVLGGDPIPAVKESKGTYDFYLLWFDALKLKLGSGRFRPPPEPAHFRVIEELARFRPPPEPAHYRPLEELARLRPSLDLGRFRPPPEPAHWFDPGILISEAEQVVIVALDEVYPELRLVERISSYRRGEEVALNPQPLPPKALAKELAKVLGPLPDPWKEELLDVIRRYGPVPDPWRAKMLEELIEVIRRYGPGPQPWKG